VNQIRADKKNIRDRH